MTIETSNRSIKKKFSKVKESLSFARIGATVIGPVENKPNFLRVKVSTKLELDVFNTQFPPSPGLRVLIEPDRYGVNRWKIVSARDAYTKDFNFPLILRHGQTHSWMGGDVAWIYMRQFLPLRPSVNNANKIKVDVLAGWFNFGGRLRYFAGVTAFSLLSYVPASGARYVLLTIDNTDALKVTSGTVAASLNDLDITYVPEIPSDEPAVAVIRLIAGTRRIRDVMINTDLHDVRFTGNGSAQPPSFLDLTDTPNTYIGKAGYSVVVNGAEDGLEFVEAGGGSGGGNPLFFVDGFLVASVNPGGAYICAADMEISLVYIHCSDTGSAGNTIVDVNLNGTTIFTTQANRPTLAYNDLDQVAVSGTPDVIACAVGDVLTIDIDQVATGAETLSVVVAFVSGGSGGAPAGADYWVETTHALLANEVVVGSKGITSVAFSSRQAAEKAGRLFLPSDGLHIWRDTGTVWQPWGPIFPMEPPVLDDFMWVNQAGSTATDERGAITIVPPLDTQIHMLVQAPPTTPYTITVGFVFGGIANYNFFGLCWRNSSSGLVQSFFAITRNVMAVNRSTWTSSSTISGDQYIVYPPGSLVFLRIHDDGTNITMSWSATGYNFTVYEVLDRTNFLTTYDQVGVCFGAYNAQFQPKHTWMHWRQE